MACRECLLGRASRPGTCPFHNVKKRAGQLVLEQGVVPEQMWLVRVGALLLSSVSAAGDEVLCSVRGAGSLVGLELLRGEPTDYEAWALGDVELCALDADTFNAWLGDRESPTGAMLHLALAEGAQRRAERIALAGSAVARVARFLLEQYRAGARSLELEQRVLARMLGLRAETVSRALKQLRGAGAIANVRGVCITDADALSRFVDS